MKKTELEEKQREIEGEKYAKEMEEESPTCADSLSFHWSNSKSSIIPTFLCPTY